MKFKNTCDVISYLLCQVVFHSFKWKFDFILLIRGTFNFVLGLGSISACLLIGVDFILLDRYPNVFYFILITIIYAQ